MRTTLTYLLWPFVIAAGTYGTYLGLAAGYPVPVVFFAVGASMLACVLAAEQLIPRRPDWNALADSNYANILPIWDIVFGTFSDPARHAPGEVGVRDDPIPEGFVAQLLSPFTWQRLVIGRSARGYGALVFAAGGAGGGPHE